MQVLLAAASTYYLLAFIVCAGRRLGYPYQLEWMEGGSVEHVRRILAGHALYAEPALGFVAFIYTPLYFYVGAAMSAITGPELAPLRLVSLLSTVGCLTLIGIWVHRETRQALPALLAAGLFAATWWIAGAWFDLARVDSLFLLLTLTAAWLLRFRANTLAAQIAAGLFIVAAYQTKQSALMIFAPLMLSELVTRRNWVTPATAALVGLLSIGVLHWVSDGWYWFYTITLPSRHEILPRMFIVFWLDDLFKPLPVAMLLAFGWLIGGRVADGARGRWFYWTLAAGMFGAACSSRMHAAGYLNVNMPALAMLGILTGLAVGAPHAWSRHQPSFRGVASRGVLYLVCLLQLVALYHSPRRFLPSAQDNAAGDLVSSLIAGYDGEVLVPYHGYLAARAGKDAFAHAMASFDLRRSGTPPAGVWEENMNAAIAQQRFDAIIVDTHPGMVGFQDALAASYEVIQTLYADDEYVFWPISGMRTRPWKIYEPRSEQRNADR